MAKLRVGVLMGGKSIEREVSFNSGRTVCDHLDTRRFEVVPIFQRSNGALYILPWRFVHRGKISDFESRLDTQATHITWDELSVHVDFVYIALHGRFAEDGTLQGMLEVLNIPYLGSKIGPSALSMDKIMQRALLQNSGIAIPPGVVVRASAITDGVHACVQHVLAELEAACIPAPWIVKPHKEGSSLGMSVVHTPDELARALTHAAYIFPDKPQDVLVEEKVVGMEFTCIMLIDRLTGKPYALPPTISQPFCRASS